MSNRPRQLAKLNYVASICASFQAFSEIHNFILYKTPRIHFIIDSR